MKRIVARELMDDPVDSRRELEGNLTDIEFANRVFGGIRPVLRELRACSMHSLLDVCCGSADVPFAVARDARRRGRPIALTVLDRSESMLDIARSRGASDVSGTTFVVGDATTLPFADASFDVVTCNLAVHHFEPAGAAALLREIRRVARVMPLVSDVRRSTLGFVAALVWARAGTRNRLTRHDAPLSVRRAYTPRELTELARAAGWQAPRVRSEPFFRMTLVDRTGPRTAVC